ncbi:MAG TPA: lysozyme inhibitor LprI family protein [Stellaceae bacterium]|nr:lysozyme inhibitor LprI family protein [Stellaceae bacterium]
MQDYQNSQNIKKACAMLKMVLTPAIMTLTAAAALAALLMGRSVSPAAAASPSFACSGSLSPTEAVICANDNLAALDRSLAAIYDNKLGSLPTSQREELASTEKTWLAERNSCGANTSCINNAYLVRIGQLGGVPPSPNNAAADGPSCNQAVGPAQAATYVSQCTQVSPATHPPCNAANSCALIISEIRRSCALIGAGAPTFCAAYRN